MESMSIPLDILIVEDNQADLFLLKKMLKSGRLDIKNLYTAERIDEASNFLHHQQVHLALLDLSLPDSFGIQSFLGLKKAAKTIPVIILTGLTDTNLALEAIKAGAMDYLVKGEFNEAVLARAIRYSFERVQNIEAIRKSNERFNMAVKAANDAIWDWDLIADEVFFEGDTFQKLFGYEITNRSVELSLWHEWVHPKDQQRVKQRFDELAKGNNRNVIEDEYRLRKRDGSYAYVYSRGYMLYDSEGKAIRMIGALQDITHRKMAEERIRESEAKYRHMFYSNPFPSFIFDIKTKTILEVNDSAIEKYGYSRDEFLSLTIDAIRLSKEGEFPKENAAGAKDSHQLQLQRHRKKNGEIMFVEACYYPTRHFSQSAMQGQMNDITERIKLEEELAMQQLMRQQEITLAVLTAQENERTMLGEELHDNINQILTGVSLYLSVAMSNPAKREEMIVKCRENLSMATEEIRKLSRSLILPGLKTMSLVKSLDELIQDTRLASSLEIVLEHQNVNEQRLMEDQKVALYRIVQEQLSNILKHAKAKKVILRIYSDGESIFLNLTDDGNGFDITAQRKGVGITNIISRAQVYDGDVKIETAPGKGCNLKVTMRIK